MKTLNREEINTINRYLISSTHHIETYRLKGDYIYKELHRVYAAGFSRGQQTTLSSSLE